MINHTSASIGHHIVLWMYCSMDMHILGFVVRTEAPVEIAQTASSSLEIAKAFQAACLEIQAAEKTVQAVLRGAQFSRR